MGRRQVVPDDDLTSRVDDELAAASDSDEDATLTLDDGRSKTALEKQRARHQILDSFLLKTTIAEAKAPRIRPANQSDEKQSIHALIAQQGVQIVKNPRQYQMELFERAQQANTIAVLDTGSGKTLIAVLLLRWVIDKELDHRANGNPPRMSFFLVDSVTLVYQQHSVLETNLDHKIARICGADNTKPWRKERWTTLIAENKVIVCTAEILREALGHGFISMDHINLLIFDEAHHTKKDHPYARIIKDYYATEPKNTRPRIFGMTASPIDSKGDATAAADELEFLLDSQIATTNDMSLTDAIKKPDEHVLRYPALQQDSPETAFLRAVRARCQGFDWFETVFENTHVIARELGRWCVDLYLADSLSQNKLLKYELQIEQNHHRRYQQTDDNTNILNEKQRRLRDVIAFAGQEQIHHLALQEGDLTEKVKQLQYYLGREFERPTENRCIVFVQSRNTARLLAALFKKIGTRHIRCTYLIGSRSGDPDGANVSFRQQVMTLLKFRKGEVNCLFATSVAEEGLDVPDCNLVIRFDLYTTMIQYVQSRGRARKRNSKFIHMVEIGNQIQAELIHEVRYQELEMRRFCQKLPADRKLVGDQDYLEMLQLDEETSRTWIEPSTGAKLTYGNALNCLAMFVSAIPTIDQELLSPFYVMTSRGQKFVAEVMLPEDSPVRSAVGMVCARKGLAKRSAAFEAAVQLRKKGYLNEHLLPIYVKKLPAMRNALLAAGMDKSDSYPMRTKPKIWEETRGVIPTELWVTIIDFKAGLDRPHRPLTFLTKSRMPQFPEFPLYLMDGRMSTVTSVRLNNPLKLTGSKLAQITEFTLKIFKDVFSKIYDPEKTDANLSYWILPAAVKPQGNVYLNGNAEDETPLSMIDWGLVDAVTADDKDGQWSRETSDGVLIDRFFVDRWDGSRKFVTTGISKTLQPHDPVPDDAAKGGQRENILRYSVQLWRKSKQKAIWEPVQPVVEAEKIVLGRNLLCPPTQKDLETKTKAYLCPQPLRISTLPTDMVTSCFAWPAVIHRFEDLMIAMEAAKLVGVQCDPGLALAAITKDSNSVDEGQNVSDVRFQHGMGENYERLEFMGDTFLKTTTTIATYILNPNDHEFEMHVKRMLMLCNKNLYNVGLKLKTYELIRSLGFSRLWYPEGLTLIEGRGKNKDTAHTETHKIGQKAIADVSEAFIGAAFIAHNKPGSWDPNDWENAVQTVTKLVESPDHVMRVWSDYRLKYEIPEYRKGEVSASQLDLVEKIEQEHPYHFNCAKLLRSAFLHPSQPFTREKIPNYQRLEFLGDALLDLACVTHLYYRFPGKDPGWLTEHKMAMVSNKFLGAVCVNLGFHRHLRHNHAALQAQIGEYVTDLLEAKQVAGATMDYWTTVSDPPKCLADIVESYVGALFIDSDFDYGQVQRFFDSNMKPYFADMTPYDTYVSSHPCTHLHKLMQANFGCRDYAIMAKEIPTVIESERGDVMAVVIIHDEVVTHSGGKSGHYSKLRAATKAVEELEGLAPYEFRSRFGCNCHLKARDEASAVQVDATDTVRLDGN